MKVKEISFTLASISKESLALDSIKCVSSLLTIFEWIQKEGKDFPLQNNESFSDSLYLSYLKEELEDLEKGKTLGTDHEVIKIISLCYSRALERVSWLCMSHKGSFENHEIWCKNLLEYLKGVNVNSNTFKATVESFIARNIEFFLAIKVDLRSEGFLSFDRKLENSIEVFEELFVGGEILV